MNARRTTGKARAKAKKASRTSQPRKSATTSTPKVGRAKSAPKGRTQAKSAPKVGSAKSAPKVGRAKSAPKGRAPAKSAPKASATSRAGAKREHTGAAKPVRLLAGGNPQIAKSDGDAPVQAYIAAMPGWKREVGKQLDALIVRTVPRVQKAVKWNSPFYGIEGRGWFLGVHTYAKYIKLAFFRGTSLRPPPPGSSKSGEVRYLDIREEDELDEAELTNWLEQAAALPGWIP
jgi:hypothetical protein